MNYLKLLEESPKNYLVYDLKIFLTVACVCLHFLHYMTIIYVFFPFLWNLYYDERWTLYVRI